MQYPTALVHALLLLRRLLDVLALPQLYCLSHTMPWETSCVSPALRRAVACLNTSGLRFANATRMKPARLYEAQQ